MNCINIKYWTFWHCQCFCGTAFSLSFFTFFRSAIFSTKWETKCLCRDIRDINLNHDHMVLILCNKLLSVCISFKRKSKSESPLTLFYDALFKLALFKIEGLSELKNKNTKKVSEKPQTFRLFNNLSHFYSDLKVTHQVTMYFQRLRAPIQFHVGVNVLKSVT